MFWIFEENYSSQLCSCTLAYNSVLWQFKHILEINTQEQSTEEYRCKSGINLCLSLFKGTASVILSDSSCRDVNARYTTVYNIYP